MNDVDSIEVATRRLLLALDALEAAAERRSEADHDEELLADQVHALGSDRAKLASELDEVTARVRVLEIANREVMRRIDQAIETIRDVLSSDNSADDKPETEPDGNDAAVDDPDEDEPADDDTADDDSEEDDSGEDDDAAEDE